MEPSVGVQHSVLRQIDEPSVGSISSVHTELEAWASKIVHLESEITQCKLRQLELSSELVFAQHIHAQLVQQRCVQNLSPLANVAVVECDSKTAKAGTAENPKGGVLDVPESTVLKQKPSKETSEDGTSSATPGRDTEEVSDRPQIVEAAAPLGHH